MSSFDFIKQLANKIAKVSDTSLQPVYQLYLKLSRPLQAKKSEQENAMDIIHQAAGKGDLQQLKIILSMDNPCFDIPDAHGDTPLFYAARAGHFEVVEFLLEHGANAEHVNIAGQSALFGAVANQHFKIIDKLIAAGALPSLADESGNTLLHHALLCDQHASLVFLLEGKMLDVNAINHLGQTPLCIAAEKQMVASCKILVQKEANIDLYDSHGWTPLMLAVAKGHFEIVNYLIGYGASVSVYDKDFRQTPYLIATRHGHVRIMELLLKQGANPEETDYYNRTAFHIAVETNKLEAVEFVLKTSVDIHARDRFGLTAKEWAIVNAPAAILGAILKAEKEREQVAQQSKKITLEDLKPQVDMGYLPEGISLLKGATEQQNWQNDYEKKQKKDAAEEKKLAAEELAESLKTKLKTRAPSPAQTEEESNHPSLEQAAHLETQPLHQQNSTEQPADASNLPSEEKISEAIAQKKAAEPIDINDIPMDEPALLEEPAKKTEQS